MLPLRRARVWSLVRELRSHKPYSVTKKKNPQWIASLDSNLDSRFFHHQSHWVHCLLPQLWNTELLVSSLNTPILVHSHRCRDFIVGKGTSPTRLDRVNCFSSWAIITTRDTSLLLWVLDGFRSLGGIWGRPRAEPRPQQPTLLPTNPEMHKWEIGTCCLPLRCLWLFVMQQYCGHSWLINLLYDLWQVT